MPIVTSDDGSSVTLLGQTENHGVGGSIPSLATWVLSRRDSDPIRPDHPSGRRPLGWELRNRPAILDTVITRYVEHALRRARYRRVDGSYCATVPGLRGVIATGTTREVCRAQLSEVVEEWVLVRVARGLRVPPLDGATIEVKKAS